MQAGEKDGAAGRGIATSFAWQHESNFTSSGSSFRDTLFLLIMPLKLEACMKTCE